MMVTHQTNRWLHICPRQVMHFFLRSGTLELTPEMGFLDASYHEKSRVETSFLAARSSQWCSTTCIFFTCLTAAWLSFTAKYIQLYMIIYDHIYIYWCLKVKAGMTKYQPPLRQSIRRPGHGSGGIKEWRAHLATLVGQGLWVSSKFVWFCCLLRLCCPISWSFPPFPCQDISDRNFRKNVRSSLESFKVWMWCCGSLNWIFKIFIFTILHPWNTNTSRPKSIPSQAAHFATHAGQAALSSAARCRSWEALHFLVLAGVQLDTSAGQVALLAAAGSNNCFILKVLEEGGLDTSSDSWPQGRGRDLFETWI